MFDFPQPFYENVDAHLKSIYNILFIKEINHNSRTIRLHNAYDSGKGMRYVAFSNEKPCVPDLTNWTIPKPADVSKYTIDDLEQICVNGEKRIAVKLYGDFLTEHNCRPDMPCWIPELSQFIENPTLIKPRIDFIKQHRVFK
jgi:hypothetical protein